MPDWLAWAWLSRSQMAARELVRPGAVSGSRWISSSPPPGGDAAGDDRGLADQSVCLVGGTGVHPLRARANAVSAL